MHGSPFQKEFAKRCEELGLPHYFTYPRSPKQNTYVEISYGADEREFYRQGNLAWNFNIMRARIKEWQGTVSLFGWSFVFEFDQAGNDLDAGIRRFHAAKALQPLLKHAHEVLHAVGGAVMPERREPRELIGVGKIAFKYVPGADVSGIAFFEKADMPPRFGEHCASDADTAYFLPYLPSIVRLQEPSAAELSQGVRKDVERAMLVDGTGKMVSHRCPDAGAPVRHNTRNPYLFAHAMAKDTVVAVSQLVARKEDPGNGHRPFGIESDVQREGLFPDHEMLSVEHEDADAGGHPQRHEHSRHYAVALRPLDAPPRGHMSHAPALAQTAERRSVCKIAYKPAPVFLMMLFLRPEGVPA